MNEMIRDMLIKAAQEQRVLIYSEVAEPANLDMSYSNDRREIGRILEEICTEEYENGRPLLSAVVVHKGNHLPGEGFFKLARRLRKQKPDEHEKTFHERELKRVFDEWSQHAKNDKG